MRKLQTILLLTLLILQIILAYNFYKNSKIIEEFYKCENMGGVYIGNNLCLKDFKR